MFNASIESGALSCEVISQLESGPHEHFSILYCFLILFCFLVSIFICCHLRSTKRTMYALQITNSLI